MISAPELAAAAAAERLGSREFAIHEGDERVLFVEVPSHTARVSPRT